MFTVTDRRHDPATQETDRDGADAAYLRFVEEGFRLDPELCNTTDTVLVRGEEQVRISYGG